MNFLKKLIPGLTGRKVSVAGVLLLAFLLGLIPAAGAADFTFKVSVDMKELHPDLQKARVTCMVAANNAGFNQPIGSGHQDFPKIGNTISKSNYTISFDADNGKNPADAKVWKCYTMLFGPGAPPNGVQMTPENAGKLAWAYFKKGTSHNSEAQGNLPLN